MKQVSAILLAAGESRRMGGINKLGIPIGGVPLLRRTAHSLIQSKLGEIVAVVGHEEEVARGFLDGLPLKIVANMRYREGQMSSVHCGLAALSAPCEGVMIFLSDQPLLETADIDDLVNRFLSEPGISVLVPSYRGQRGNPIILSYRHRQDILSGERNLGCKHFIEKNPALVTGLEMENDHVVFDLDTPEDLKQLQLRLQQKQIRAVPARA